MKNNKTQSRETSGKKGGNYRSVKWTDLLRVCMDRDSHELVCLDPAFKHIRNPMVQVWPITNQTNFWIAFFLFISIPYIL